jgi:hypothetical protein
MATHAPSPAIPPPGATITVTQTAVFELRAPSAWKRAAILDAMKRTHLATDTALRAILTEIDGIRALPAKDDRTATIQRLVYGALSGWSLGGASAAAARVDAMGMAEGYLGQLQDGRETTGLPSVRPLQEQAPRHLEALAALAGTHATLAQEAALRDELNRAARPARLRPLSLHGYGHFYQLLRHPKTGRVYAWINLLPKSSRYAPSQAEANEAARKADGEMVDLATGERVLCKKPTWLLFPLSFGFDFHERRYLLAGQPGGGRLVYEPEQKRFTLHASFTFTSPAIDTGRRFLGIDRGIYNLAAWAAVTADGAVLEDGVFSGLGLRHVQRVLERRAQLQQQRGRVPKATRQAQAIEAVHTVANALAALAKRHQARVVVEELTLRCRLRALPKRNRSGTSGRNARRILGRQQYARLLQLLTYKLARLGLPPPLAVAAAYTSQTCLECGHIAAENRPKRQRPGQDTIDMSRFLCVRCGHAADADCNAARVIGTKGAWLAQLPRKKERGGRALHEHETWPAYLRQAAKRRGATPAPSPSLPATRQLALPFVQPLTTAPSRSSARTAQDCSTSRRGHKGSLPPGERLL